MAAIRLSARNLCAFYGQTKVLHGLDFEVPEGGVTTFLGANGAGKTSTLRALCGMIRATGEIMFDGNPIAGCATEEVARLGIAHVPEGRGTFSSMTVEENLQLGAMTRSDRAGVVQDIERAYGYFPRLGQRRRQQAGTLSGGEQQMLAIARALIRDPKIILLDEPFEGLAPLIVRDLVRVCRELAAGGQTIVLVEQNLAATLALASRVYIINNGHIAHEGPAGQLKAQPEILHRHLGV